MDAGSDVSIYQTLRNLGLGVGILGEGGILDQDVGYVRCAARTTRRMQGLMVVVVRGRGDGGGVFVTEVTVRGGQG